MKSEFLTAISVMMLMALGCGAELTEDDIPLCLDQMTQAFKGYVVPNSVRLYAESMRQTLTDSYGTDAQYRTPLDQECQVHLDKFNEITSKIPCHKQLSESIDYYDEYDEATRMYNPHLYRIIKGARSCV